jgi:hypothetical protein
MKLSNMKKNVFIIVVSLLFLGCSANTDYIMEEDFEFSPVLRSGEALTIISDYYLTEDGQDQDKEKMFQGCLSKAFRKQNINLRIISSEEFKGKAFSGTNREKLAHDLESFILLLKKPKVIAKIREFNLRYIIVLKCSTGSDYQETDWEGGGYGVFVLVGHHKWQRRTYVEAILVDVKQDFKTGMLSTQTSGSTSLITTCLIPTMAWSATTESDACKNIAKRIVEYWVNSKSDKD